ncbi:spore germination protein [Clostridium thermarum]|uniref:spore germination protein n=1 Tax=Clostridium thermarum TaxID=1716543 RepID=UPI0013D3B4EB|nr:spore germination protein [Clostridium thermarum]
MNVDILNTNICSNIKNISSNLPSNANFINRRLIIPENIGCNILYISGIADKTDVQEIVLKPLLNTNIYLSSNSNTLVEELIEKKIYSSEVTVSSSIKNICSEIMNGKCAILLDNVDKAVICNVTSSKYRNITESTTEKSIFGSRESFVENIDLNLTMLQRKLKNPDFKIEKYTVGNKTNTEVALTYIDGIIDPLVLSNIKSKLLTISTPILSSSGMLEQLFDDKPCNIFPMAKTTELPDKTMSDLVQGKAAIFIAETSSALIIPATFIEFFQGSEDYTDNSIISSFSRLLRLISIITVIILEPIYLTLLIHNPELFPYKLISVVISSRQNIPLPPFLEIFAMDLAVEILREGGLRLPNPIGTTLAIVGGIVIGQSATKASLVSDITLFIVALTVISTFIIPNYQMTLTIRFIRFPLLILAQIFGFFGLLSGLYLFLVILIKMDNFGVEYFSPFIPMRFSDLADTIIRGPLKKVLSNPKSLHPSKKTKK